ncbi:MAG TPA: sugar transferase [Vicinamibacterales bacterium]|nr:sugar transferase [Vicinamibacterales bacterium]
MMKRTFDVLLSSMGLLLMMPVSVLIAIVVKLEDGGPILFGQERVGLDGGVFKAWKFRSMIPDAESVTGPVQATANDPRITRTGALLRATAMDELPQLWNILRGDMSFVGPRPLRPGEKDSTGDGVLALETIPGYADRHRVRPGLTGLAQVYAPRDAPRPEKFRYDLEYVARRTMWLDCRLMAQSLLITLRGAWERHDPRRHRRA